MKHIFIINPVSGKKDAGRLMVPHIIETAKKHGIEYETIPTKAPHHAMKIARQYSKIGEPVRFYAVGGDGTLNEVLRGAYPYTNTEVASIPCGSGNDFVRSFGRPEDFLNLDEQIVGTAVPIDLIKVDEGISAAITSIGLDANVAYNIPKYRRFPLLGGTMAYNVSIIEQLLKPLGNNLRITIDGNVQEGKYIISAVCNGQTYGGGYRAAPMAKLDDGELEVILVKKLSRTRIAAVINKYKNGLHIVNDEVIPEMQDIMQFYRAKEVMIEPLEQEKIILNVDGECGPAKRLYAKVLPKAARFVLPQPLANKLQEEGLAMLQNN